MCSILRFIEKLYEYLTGNKCVVGNIIRRHSKKLDQLGDVSFPLNIKSWSQIIDKSKLVKVEECTIFDYFSPDKDFNSQLESLVKESKSWPLTIDNYKIKNGSDVHLYLNRYHLMDLCIKEVLEEKATYGLKHSCVQSRISIILDHTVNSNESEMNLTELRIIILQKIISNFLSHLTSDDNTVKNNIRITFNSNEKQKNVLICGSVLNEGGVKDLTTTAVELYKKRALDMQLMAQHKYGVQVKPLPLWTDYFDTLGKASVTIEMLQNKSHKATKITLSNLQTTNKGSSFIFYNCARLSALFKEFDSRVSKKIYPDLPHIDKIDFTLLSQSEEWELVYAYILQFPVVVNSCICDIKSGMINMHHLVSFLSNLSSIFSVYYRRVKILTTAKDHLLPVLYARIYLLKVVQQVFHTALHLLDIEPTKEM